MKTFSKKKKIFFWFLMVTLLFTVLNMFAWFFARTTVFWQNPLMMIYPVEEFDSAITQADYHHNKHPKRMVRYVPDKNRWYRLDPEPEIPKQGKLLLHFGDSSTWGWGLADKNSAYPNVMNTLLLGDISSINLGVPGYSSLQGLRYVEEVLPKYRERVVAITIYFGNNDATENGLPDKKKMLAVQNQTPWWHVFPLLQLVNERVTLFVNLSNREPRVNPQNYKDNIANMLVLANKYNVAVVAIMPPVHYSWPSGHVTHTLSLAAHVNNSWVKQELEISSHHYQKGLNFMYNHDDSYEEELRKSVEHDWVVPRIKNAWRETLVSIFNETNIPIVQLPDYFVEAEHPYCFEDYCHPTGRVHAAIAKSIMQHLK